MDTGYLLLALIAIPLFTAAALVFVPSEKKDLVRQLSVASGLVLFIISLYVFIDYQANDKVQFLSTLRWTWIENVGIFKENGITLHLGIDGIAAVMLLLNGVVTFAGTLISWKI